MFDCELNFSFVHPPCYCSGHSVNLRKCKPQLIFCLGGNDGKFSIGPETGALSSQALDREMTSEYCLTITATDHGIEPLSATTKVMVTVVDENDNDPAFTEKVSQKGRVCCFIGRSGTT